MTPRTRRRAPLAVAVVLALTGCASSHPARTVADPTRSPAGASSASPKASSSPVRFPLGVPVYAADAPGKLSPVAARAASLVYVPDLDNNLVVVIDPKTYRVLRREHVGRLPQHVTPSWDLRTLWVDDDLGNELTPIDPTTGRTGKPVPVVDPYNLYFTADGGSAIVVGERVRRLDFRDPTTMTLQQTVHVPCKGVDHADFTVDGSHALFSCEFSGKLLWVDVVHRKVAGVIDLPREGSLAPKPQDVKLSPDGKTFYVADENSNGVYLVDAASQRVRSFLPTGHGAHGLYVSRDMRDLYVTNRLGGSISVVSFATGRIRTTWSIPRGTPDMGGVSADGRVLWLSGRYTGEVYAISTVTGRLLARIHVGGQPHGLCVWPQPGRFSLGHTGVLR